MVLPARFAEGALPGTLRESARSGWILVLGMLCVRNLSLASLHRGYEGASVLRLTNCEHSLSLTVFRQLNIV